jgi:Leucine-rich repeat (LRR) protein
MKTIKHFIITLTALLVLFSGKLVAQDTIRFTWAATAGVSKSVYIQATGGKTFTVNWGDDTTIETKTGNGGAYISLSHTYITARKYTVTIAASNADCRFAELNCSNNHLTDIDLTGCSVLGRISCYNNQLTDLDLTGCTVYMLDCSNNKLTKLTGCSTLSNFRCHDNQLTDLDLTDYSFLQGLYCYNNQLSSLVLTGCSALQTLYCYNNPLTILELAGCSALQSLLCNDNQLQKLDLTDCSALTELHCNNNPLTILDLTNCSTLKSLALANCSFLQTLYCQNNQLSYLVLAGCSALQTLYCYNNQLQLSDLFSAHSMINIQNAKRLGTQNIPSRKIILGMNLDFSYLYKFVESIYTKFDVKKGDEDAIENIEYTINDGIIVFLKEGNYSIIMTNDAIVSDSDYPVKVVQEIIVEKSTSIAEPKYSNFNIYPNPTTDKIYIKTEGKSIPELKLYSFDGRLLQHIQSTEIDLAGYSEGVYLLSIDGKTVKVWKK